MNPDVLAVKETQKRKMFSNTFVANSKQVVVVAVAIIIMCHNHCL